MRVIYAALVAGLSLSACATSGTADRSDLADPIEGWNRSVFAFNNVVDGAVLEPVAKGYRAITNDPVRGGVSNFLSNLKQPIVFANAVLQGKPEMALDTVGRFLFNTTVGIGGILDPASAVGVPEHREDFGQTLAVWGVPSGPYLMIPFMGPSTVRDAAGLGVDAVANPINYAKFEGDVAFRVSRAAVGTVSVRESLIETVNVLREQPEPYTALRRNYQQQRAAAVRDGKIDEDAFSKLPDFDDFDFGEDE